MLEHGSRAGLFTIWFPLLFVAGGAGMVRTASAAGDVTLGAVYVGSRDDFGWNQAHAVAAEALKLVPGVKVVDDRAKNYFPMPIDASGQDDVLVGRIPALVTDDGRGLDHAAVARWAAQIASEDLYLWRYMAEELADMAASSLPADAILCFGSSFDTLPVSPALPTATNGRGAR